MLNIQQVLILLLHTAVCTCTIARLT